MQHAPLILLAEDSPTQATAVSHVLGEAGYRVSVAATGASALALARAQPPALILSDIVMPEMGGLDLCAAIKSDPALRRVPVILLTSLDEPLDVFRGLQARAELYLIKPPDPVELREAVRSLLESAGTPDADDDLPGFEFPVHGNPCVIHASRRRLAAWLLATYQSACRTNRELQHSQEALRRHELELAQKVHARTQELERVNAGLSAAVRQLEDHEQAHLQFIDNVSHELRTPLTSMSQSVANLLGGVVGPVSDRLHRYLVMFKEDCERMLATVTDLLDLRRVDNLKLELHCMKLPLDSVVRRTARKLADAAQAKGLALNLPPEPANGFVEADPLKIERVFQNLIRNAIQFTPEGGHVRLDVEPVRDGTWMEARVTDDGIGIAPENLPRLTERYFRVGDLICGTGLGLSFCQEVLARHGAEFEIRSPPPDASQGTQVVVRMPRAAPPTVLAVDDSKTVQLLLEHQLRAFGYDCHIAESAERATAMLQDSRPDVLIVDSVLPGIDGVELIANIKTDHHLRRIPVIVITGAEIDRPHRELLESFRIPVVGKPWRMEELRDCLEDAVFGKHYLER